MKKVVFALLLFAISGMYAVNGFAGNAMDDLNNAARDGDAATSEPTDEGAKEGAGYGFDTPAPTPVDLTGKEGVVDPEDLKQYDPEPIRIQGNPPPPLP